MVPNGWKETKLIDTSAKEKYSFTGGPFGSDLKSSDYTDNGVRIIQLQNIGDGKFNNGYKIFTSEEKADELSSCNIFPGEIILSKMGDPVARATIIPSHHKRYLMASDGVRLKVDESKYDTFFIHEVINAPHFRGIALSKSTGSTRKRIGLTDLKNITFHCPPLIEQQKIAKILSTWDKAISTTERLIDNSTQQKKALMQQLMTGKKRLLDESGKRFEGEWEEVKLSKWLVEYKEKSTVQDQYDVYTSSRNGLVLQSVYFANSRIAGRDNIGFHVIPPNHITYRSRSDDGFFTFNLFSNDKNGLISNYYPVFSTKGSNEFFIALFEQYRATFGRYSVGTSQKVLSLNALKDILFKIPSIPEQRKIATVLTNADKEIELLEQQLAALQQEKKALMQVLLTGKKRVLVDG